MNFKSVKFLALLVIVALLIPVGIVTAQATSITLTKELAAVTSINENNAENTVLGVLAASGGTGPYTYAINGTTGDFASFGIDTDGESLIFVPAADYETKTSYSVTIIATDTGDSNSTYEGTFTIDINDVNEAPVITFTGYNSPSTYAMDEDGAPTVWPGLTTELTAADPDSGDTASLSWSVSVNPTNGTATVDGTGANPTTFTYAPDSNYSGTDSFTVLVTDGTLTDTQVIDISITDQPDTMTDISLSADKVAEDAALDTEVGTLTNDDPDGILDTYGYSLATTGTTCDTTNGADNASFTISGDSLLLNDTLDYETQSSLAVCIQVVDDDVTPHTYQEAFTISITDVNEAPVITFTGYTAPSTYEMSEDGNPTAWPGLVTELTAADPDSGDTTDLTWSVSANPTNGTATVDGTGANPTTFTYAPNTDYNGTDTYTVRATDTDGLYDEQVIDVTIEAVNDAPSFSYGSNIIVACTDGPVTENAWAADILSGPGTATDETAQTLSFSLTNDTTTLFSTQPQIDAETGDLTFTLAGCSHLGTATLTATLDDGQSANNTYKPAGSFTIQVTAGISISGTVASNLTCASALNLDGGIIVYLDEDGDEIRDAEELYDYVNALSGAYSIDFVPEGTSGTLRIYHIQKGYDFSVSSGSVDISDITAGATVDFLATGNRTISGTITGPNSSRLPAGTDVDFGNCLTWTAPANGTSATTSFTLTGVPPKPMLLKPVLSGSDVAAIASISPVKLYASPIVANDTVGNTFTFIWKNYTISGDVRTSTGSKPYLGGFTVKLLGTGDFAGVNLTGSYNSTLATYKVVAPYKRIPGTNDPVPFTGNLSLSRTGYEAYEYSVDGPHTMTANIDDDVTVYGDRAVYGEFDGVSLAYGTEVDFGNKISINTINNEFALSYLERKTYTLKPKATGYYFTGTTSYAQASVTVDLRYKDKDMGSNFYAWAVPKPLLPENNVVLAIAADPKPTFKWEKVPGATGYLLEASRYPAFTAGTGTITYTLGTVTTYTPTDALTFATANSTIYWRVKALGIDGAQYTSKFPALVRKFKVQYPAPTLTSPIGSVKANDSTVVFTWSAVDGLPAGAKYVLEFSKYKDFSTLIRRKIAAPTATWTETGITNASTDLKYYWRVYIINSSGNGISPKSTVGIFLR